MATLYQALKIIAICLVGIIVSQSIMTAQQNSHCALKVSVQIQDETGGHAAVKVIEEDGTSTDADVGKDGRRFCELAVGTVTVNVETCVYRVAREVELEWGKEVEIYFHIPNLPCLPRRLSRRPGSGCVVVFRPVDEGGKILYGGQGMLDDGKSIDADQYGRITVGSRTGDEVAATLSVAGFSILRVKATCAHRSPSEKKVALTRLP
jgi:hypothetical protein